MQPFIENIQTEGEYSLFFFNGEYSHAILKTPAAGDFRVQEEHGADISADGTARRTAGDRDSECLRTSSRCPPTDAVTGCEDPTAVSC